MTIGEWLYLYLHLTLIGLVEAISPLRVALILLLLSGTKPVVRSMVFIGGVATFSLIFAVLVDQTGRTVPELHEEQSTVSVIIGICLGLLLLVVAYRTWTHTSSGEGEFGDGEVGDGEVKLPKFVDRIMDLVLNGNLAAVFFGGILMQLFSLKSLILYSAGLKQIVQSGIDFPANLIALLYLIIVMLAEMIVPTVIFAASPEDSERMLTGMSQWLTQYGYSVLAVAEALLAVYLLVDSIVAFVT
jgi:hypothetical protein